MTGIGEAPFSITDLVKEETRLQKQTDMMASRPFGGKS
jgi:hypothetical protein